MTTPTLKIKITPAPKLRGKMDVRFPANVEALSPIVLDKSGGNYTFSIDLDEITANLPSLDSDLTALASNSTNGLWARTGAGTGAARTITGTANAISVTNGDGVSGNPLLSLPSSLTLAGKTIDVLSSSASYTPTFTGFGTVSTSEAYWRRVRDICELDVRFTSGTPTATEARMSLPSGLTSATISSIHLAGLGVVAHNGAAMWTVLIESGVSYVTFGIQASGSAGLTKANGSSLVSSGQSLAFRASVRISGW